MKKLKEQDRYRVLRPAEGIDFSSNDYLGFATHPALREAIASALERGVTVGSGGSRLLRGNAREHEELEEYAAKFFDAESALYFNSGFDANLAIFSSLASRHDAIIVDERIHASVKEGARASHSRKYIARHNDVFSFREKIALARRDEAREVFLAVESVYSMDGDFAPIMDLLALADECNAVLVVDDAHATGIFGEKGRGCTEGMQADNLITLHTCGKALGASGAIVAASQSVKNYLINTARPFIYSTASSPLMAVAVKQALELIDREPWLRKQLIDQSAFARKILRKFNIGQSRSQIIPIILGGERTTVETASALQKNNFDVRAIRPPTVADGTARLRISINVNRTEEEISSLAEKLHELLPEKI